MAGGQTVNGKGYVFIYMPGHHRAHVNGYVKRAVLVLEAKLGRALDPSEDTHHVNGVKSDDSPENLEAVPHWLHAVLHNAAKPIETRVCVVCKEPVARKRFRRPPSRTTCGIVCRNALNGGRA